ncbi:hypothetical protein GUY61_25625, partial [Streptomyces sp. GC420]|nr:hypothetical protein [Streptomyces sp. GC420]
MSLALVPLMAGPAAAQEPCARTGTRVQCTFDYTGALQTFTVPGGVRQLYVDALGASGGEGGSYNSGPGGAGGKGAQVKGTLTVRPSEVLWILVGGKGGDADGRMGGAGGTYGGGAGGD